MLRVCCVSLLRPIQCNTECGRSALPSVRWCLGPTAGDLQQGNLIVPLGQVACRGPVPRWLLSFTHEYAIFTTPYRFVNRAVPECVSQQPCVCASPASD